jgi:hypothetical protein
MSLGLDFVKTPDVPNCPSQFFRGEEYSNICNIIKEMGDAKISYYWRSLEQYLHDPDVDKYIYECGGGGADVNFHVSFNKKNK